MKSFEWRNISLLNTIRAVQFWSNAFYLILMFLLLKWQPKKQGIKKKKKWKTVGVSSFKTTKRLLSRLKWVLGILEQLDAKNYLSLWSSFPGLKLANALWKNDHKVFFCFSSCFERYKTTNVVWYLLFTVRILSIKNKCNIF